MAAPKAFKKNDLNIQYLDIVDEELDIDSAKTISRANMQIDPLGDGIFSVKAGNIEKFQVNIHNFENLYEVIEGTPTAFTSAQAVLDFFFDYVGSGGGTSDNGIFYCEVSYTGNGVSGDAATYTKITINNQEYGVTNALSDFSALESAVNQALSNISGGSVAVLISKSNNGNISGNNGDIKVYLQIIYPSIAIDSASIDLVINGTPQSFAFDKIPNM